MKKKTYQELLINENAERSRLLEALEERKASIEYLIEQKNKALQEKINGNLRISRNGKHFDYYLCTSKCDTHGEYIKAANRELAFKIAQRDYDSRILEFAEAETKEIRRLIRQLNEGNYEEYFASLSDGRRQLVTPVSLPDADFVEQWKNVEWDVMPVGKEYGDLTTNSGTRVRSKVELVIAETLERFNVPYRYEYPLVLKGIGQVRPDFICLNLRKRKEIVWEHFGMMDNPEYAQKNVKKIEEYEMSGYHPNDNFIMTFETSVQTLSTSLIREKVKTLLL